MMTVRILVLIVPCVQMLYVRYAIKIVLWENIKMFLNASAKHAIVCMTVVWNVVQENVKNVNPVMACKVAFVQNVKRGVMAMA